MYTTDAAGEITYFNEAAAQFWGRRPVLGELWCGSLELLFPDERPMRHDECPMAIALRERRPVRDGEAVAVRPDGSKVRFLAYPTPMFDDDGTLVGAVNVLVDVNDRHRLREEARSVTRALAASNAVKDEFLGLVSHELRTPVTTIYGNARLLQARADDLDASVKASMLADMAEEADRLHTIIENLLYLTRLGSGTPLDLEPIVLDRTVERIVRSFRLRHRARDVRLVTSVVSALVQGDESYMAVLLENLLSNADKYSPPDQPIDVRISADDDAITIVVADRGIGFGDEPVAALFEPFYRSRDARLAANGLGIGLALCQRIVAALGGQIWASPRDGGGAEIGFALPIQRFREDVG
jgi:PAS domain S-box-containing protein